MKMVKSSPNGFSKLLIMSNFSFSHSVFKRLVLQTRKHKGLFGKGLRALQLKQIQRTTILKTFSDDKDIPAAQMTKCLFERLEDYLAGNQYFNLSTGHFQKLSSSK